MSHVTWSKLSSALFHRIRIWIIMDMSWMLKCFLPLGPRILALIRREVDH